MVLASGPRRPRERPEESVLRELNEELRVSDATIVRHLGDVDYHGDVSHLWPKHGRFQHGYRMIHYQVAVSSTSVEIIDHEELVKAELLTIDDVRKAVASFPPELAEAAINFAREVISHAPATLPPRSTCPPLFPNAAAAPGPPRQSRPRGPDPAHSDDNPETSSTETPAEPQSNTGVG